MAVAAQSLPEGPGRDLVQAICSSCHDTERLTTKHWSKTEWQAKVLEMLQEEPDVTQPERDQIVQYLARAFPPSAKVNVNESAAAELAKALDIPSEQASAIVEYRKQKGPFKTLDDLKRVPGLDAAKVDAHKDSLVFAVLDSEK